MTRPTHLVALPSARRDDVTDAELVVSAAAGQRWASEALFRRHFATAVRLSWRLAPRCDAEDVAQDALVEALTHLKQLSNPAAFVGWLRGIVVRVVRGRLRRRSLLRRLGFGDADEEVDLDAVISPSTPPEASVQIRELYRAMEKLPTEERMVLALTRIEGLTNEEAAQSMGLSLATVKRRLASALAALDVSEGDA
ncbi:MAG: sigma-70 family RNA polymerase sigma factor [Archangiaceae bacterium]|nr:sigma-70 family RNA polymerase sigma factor [Archangiaceae bacterium]